MKKAILYLILSVLFSTFTVSDSFATVKKKKDKYSLAKKNKKAGKYPLVGKNKYGKKSTRTPASEGKKKKKSKLKSNADKIKKKGKKKRRKNTPYAAAYEWPARESF